VTQCFKTIEDARECIASFILFYNDQCPHSSIGMKTPTVAHTEQGMQQFLRFDALTL
jgi:hypothetical protein